LTEWPILKDWIKKLERYLLWRNEINISFSTWKTNKKPYNIKSKVNSDFTHEFYQKNKAEYPTLGPEFNPIDKVFEKFNIRHSIQHNNFNILIKFLLTNTTYKTMINRDKFSNIDPFIATNNLINNISIISRGYRFKLNFHDEDLNLYLKESLLNIIEKPFYRVIYITTIITLLNYFIL
jgi:predicted nucleic-acid-binding protein